MIKQISTNRAPAAIGPYSQAVSVGSMIYTSGQIPLDASGVLVQGDISAQTKQVLQNLTEVLKEGGSSLSDVIKTTIFLSDMKDFGDVNIVYAEFFGNHKPSRSTVAVKTLPLEVGIEIEAIALSRS